MKRALHVCPIQRCVELISSSQRYCVTHTRERRPVDTRPSSAKRGYDAEWQKIRATFLAVHPRCTYPGCALPSTEAHHVIAVRDGGSHDWNNLRAYCKRHHARITAQEQPGGFIKRKRSGDDET